jgi:hypothetical protein
MRRKTKTKTKTKTTTKPTPALAPMVQLLLPTPRWHPWM